MKYRTLGSTGITVSEIGLGAWGIGGPTEGVPSYGPVDDFTSKRALEAAFDSGVTFFDTSNLYGYGHSENLLGDVFHGKRSSVVIASKVGFVSADRHDLSPNHMRGALELSLQRLSSDYIDLYQLHSPSMDLVTPEVMAVLSRFKEEGKIRAYGLSVKHPNDGIPAVRSFGFEVLQVNFNMIDQRIIENGLLDFARAGNVGLIARTPFNFGFLTGATSGVTFGPKDHRSTWPKAQLEKWASAPNLFSFLNDGKDRTPAQLALQFCLAFPEVSSVIPGMMYSAEVAENVVASDLPPLTHEEIELIQGICTSNFSGPVKK